MSSQYILKDKTPVAVENTIEWARWFESHDRRVAYTLLNRRKGIRVSTVFLGIDHNFLGGPPLLFETMVFGTSLDEAGERYFDWESAARGHAQWVARARNARWLPAKRLDLRKFFKSSAKWMKNSR